MLGRAMFNLLALYCMCQKIYKTVASSYPDFPDMVETKFPRPDTDHTPAVE